MGQENKVRLLICLAAVAAISGCVTSPPPAGAAVSAYSVGDGAHVVFDEVVVSLPFVGAHGLFQNLHVTPAAVINVRNTTSSDAYEAAQILRRLETRVAARLSEALSSLGPQSLADTPSLRQRVLKEVQPLVDEALRQWKHGADYRVEMVITSLYWTDASVGRSLHQGGRW